MTNSPIVETTFSISAHVGSGTIGINTMYIINEDDTDLFDDIIESYGDDLREVKLGTFRGQPDVLDLMQGRIDGQVTHIELRNYLTSEYKLDRFYMSSLIIIKLTQTAELNDGEIIKKLVMDYVIPDLQISLGDYELYGVFEENVIMDIPYQNATLGADLQCVKSYIFERYPKLSKNIINKFFPDNEKIKIKHIITWTTRKKIPCELYNIFGDLVYKSETPYNRTRNSMMKKFLAIIFRNHLYPLTDSSTGPKLPTAKSIIPESKVDRDQQVVLTKGTNSYTAKSKIVKSENIINSEFFEGIPPNFLYEAEECIDMKPIVWRNPEYPAEKLIDGIDIDGTNLTKIDMNKAYYNCVMNYQGSFPIFSVLDMWKPYEGELINDLDYYTIEDMPDFFQNNLTHGFMVKWLIQNDYITRENILFVKNSRQGIDVITVQRKIKAVREKLFKGIEYNIDEFDDEPITGPICQIGSSRFEAEYQKGFALYNGILGKKRSDYRREINQCLDQDLDLLEAFYANRNIKYIRGVESFALVNEPKYKHINNRNIYNLVVDLCNLRVLQMMANYSQFTPIEIKTDSITFDIPSEKFGPLPEGWKFEKIFKAVSIERNFNFIDINIIKAQVIEEIYNCSLGNQLFTGAPGTGKTYKLKNEFDYDMVVTIANLCKMMLMQGTDKPAETFYKYFNIYKPENIIKHITKTMKGKTLALDEFSMLPQIYLNYVFIARKYSLDKVIFLGDINQIPPINGPGIELNNPFIRIFFQNSEELKIDYRNDSEIINLRNEILNMNSEETKKELFRNLTKSNIKRSLTPKFLDTCDIAICYTKRRRAQINKYIMEKRGLQWLPICECWPKAGKPKRPKFVKTIEEMRKGKWTCTTTYKHIWKFTITHGTRLYCSSGFTYESTSRQTASKFIKIHKGDLVEVLMDVNTRSNEAVIKSIHSGITHTIPANCLKYFNPGHCINVHLTQGLTLPGKICILEIALMLRRDKRLFYTALTRATNIQNIYFMSRYDEIPLLKPYDNVGKLPDMRTPEEREADIELGKISKELIEINKMKFGNI